jgi:hypothetical protein
MDQAAFAGERLIWQGQQTPRRVHLDARPQAEEAARGSGGLA